MPNKLELIKKRKQFKEIVIDTNPDQYPIEMSIYDTMLNSRLNYIDNCSSDLTTLIKLTKKIDDNKRDFELESMFHDWREKYGEAPAFLFALNFDPDKNHENHRFGGDKENPIINKHITDDTLFNELYSLSMKDGAILIRPSGEIYGVRCQLTNINPKEIYKDRKDIDLNDRTIYGFKERTDTRHYSALGASYHLNDLITYTLSSQTGNIRRYKEGKITFSTHPEE